MHASLPMYQNRLSSYLNVSRKLILRRSAFNFNAGYTLFWKPLINDHGPIVGIVA